jgi:hypothetical protein
MSIVVVSIHFRPQAMSLHHLEDVVCEKKKDSDIYMLSHLLIAPANDP